jgi:isocitrate dehydrogenase
MASIERTISSKRVTYDLARMIPGSTTLKTSEFATAMIQNM